MYLTFPGCFVSDQGRVPGRSGRIMKAKPAANGYPRVTLWKDGRNHYRNVHRLVLLAFVGEPEKGQEALHLNDVKSDPRLANLVWGTHQQNGQDASKNGRQPRGTKHWNARFTEAQVDAIRRDGRTQRVIAQDFGCSKQTVSDIKLGRRRAKPAVEGDA